MRKVLVAVGLFALGLAWAAPAGAAAGHKLAGTMTVAALVERDAGVEPDKCATAMVTNDPNYKAICQAEGFANGTLPPTPSTTPPRCFTDSGYDDLATGAQVTVRNASGKTIALSRLKGGGYDTDGGSCVFTFSVKVPDSKFYGVEVSHRGEVSYSKKQLVRNRWKVNLSVG